MKKGDQMRNSNNSAQMKTSSSSPMKRKLTIVGGVVLGDNINLQKKPLKKNDLAILEKIFGIVPPKS